MTDRALAAAAASGDQAALTKVFRLASPPLWAIARGMTERWADAEELLQIGLIRAVRPQTLRGFRDESSLKTYLVKVGLRAMRAEVRLPRHERYRGEVPSEDLGSSASVPSHEDMVVAGLDGPAMRELKKLPLRARMVVLLHVVGDLRFEDIAVELNLSVGNVKATYSRARKALERALGSDESPSR